MVAELVHHRKKLRWEREHGLRHGFVLRLGRCKEPIENRVHPDQVRIRFGQLSLVPRDHREDLTLLEFPRLVAVRRVVPLLRLAFDEIPPVPVYDTSRPRHRHARGIARTPVLRRGEAAHDESHGARHREVHVLQKDVMGLEGCAAQPQIFGGRRDHPHILRVFGMRMPEQVPESRAVEERELRPHEVFHVRNHTIRKQVCIVCCNIARDDKRPLTDGALCFVCPAVDVLGVEGQRSGAERSHVVQVVEGPHRVCKLNAVPFGERSNQAVGPAKMSLALPVTVDIEWNPEPTVFRVGPGISVRRILRKAHVVQILVHCSLRACDVHVVNVHWWRAEHVAFLISGVETERCDVDASFRQLVFEFP
mmetsp:Transcript_25295/g.74011  ORF Transcript_25295/g.74011 Transcript_25295/m.74011 type:complete len:364 (-) Transcript_25295:580-1671(-)|eukprot:2814052-Prymnesium_polylepis.1